MKRLTRCVLAIAMCGLLTLLSGCALNPFERINSVILDRLTAEDTLPEAEHTKKENEDLPKAPDGADKKENIAAQNSQIVTGADNAEKENSIKGDEGYGSNGASTSKNNTTASKDNESNSNNSQDAEKENEITEPETPETAVDEEIPDLSDVTDSGLTDNSAKTYGYGLGGDLKSWIEGDGTVYAVTTSPNLLCAFKADGGSEMDFCALAGIPAEVRYYSGKVYVSIPSLKKILIYNAKTLEQAGTMEFTTEVSSFCIDGDFIYYTEHDQHCDVFCKEMSSGAITKIRYNLTGNGSYYFPKLQLNKEKDMLCIGESGSSGGTLYYFNLSDLSLNSYYEKNNYGYANRERDMWVHGGNVYWGEFKFDGSNAETVLAQYHNNSYNSIMFANDSFVCTYEGIFDEKTGLLLVDYASQSVLSDAPTMITKNNTLIVFVKRYNSKDVNVAVCIPMK